MPSWESFSPLLSYSGHLSLLPGDQGVSSLEQGILEHFPPALGSLETAFSPGVSLQQPSVSLQILLDFSLSTQGRAVTAPSTQKALGSSDFEPLEYLPVAPKSGALSTLSQETPSLFLPVHGFLELPQYDSVALPSMPSTQGLKGCLLSSEVSLASVPSA